MPQHSTGGTQPVTLADVARAAGVHAATVSRSISRPELVHAETLERVTLAARRLGYVPHRGARHLAGGRTNVLAILVPDIANPFFAGIISAAQQRAAHHSSLVMVADTELNSRIELELVRTMRPNVDAIIGCSPVASTAALREAAGSCPLVFVNRAARHVPTVVLDQRAIVTIALDHLESLGHRRIGVVLGPPSFWSSAQRAAVVRGRPAVIPLRPAAPSFEGGLGAIDDVVRSRVSAVVAFNDLMALGVMAGASRRGIRVPEELSVVGSDDVAIAAMANPALTTVAAPLDVLGSVAVDLATASAGDEHRSGRRVGVHLVVRASTMSPPAEAPSIS